MPTVTWQHRDCAPRPWPRLPRRCVTPPVAPSAVTLTLTLPNLMPPGDEWWSIDPGTSQHDYTVRSTVPAAEIAAGLAEIINASGGDFSAAVDGNTLVIGDTDTTSYTPRVGITDASTAGSYSITVVSPTTTRITLGGTSAIGEGWVVTLNGSDYTYAGESVEVIAAQLAAQINATAHIVRVVLTATAPVAGDIWKVSITLNSAPQVFSYAAVSGDDLTDVIGKLAGLINSAALSNLAAFADGEDLMLVTGSAVLPTVGVTRQPSGSTAVIVPTTVATDTQFVAIANGAQVLIIQLAGTLATPATDVAPRNAINNATAVAQTVTPTTTPVVGETWRGTINTESYSHTFPT